MPQQALGSNRIQGRLQVRNLRRATSQHQRKNQQQTASHAKIISIVPEYLSQTFAAAEYVLGNKEIAHRFLTTSHAMLNGKTPIETALSEEGASQIQRLLFSLFYVLPV
jgi:uncharacterized protein (DUF2384 family)